MNGHAQHDADNWLDAQRDALDGRDRNDWGPFGRPWDAPEPHEAEQDRQS